MSLGHILTLLWAALCGHDNTVSHRYTDTQTHTDKEEREKGKAYKHRGVFVHCMSKWKTLLISHRGGIGISNRKPLLFDISADPYQIIMTQEVETFILI